MEKQELIDKGYIHIATRNDDSCTEVWARFTGEKDLIECISYIPKLGVIIPSESQISYLSELELFSKMRDKMKLEFFNKRIHEQCDPENMWLDYRD